MIKMEIQPGEGKVAGKRCVINGVILGNRQSERESSLEKVIGCRAPGEKTTL